MAEVISHESLEIEKMARDLYEDEGRIEIDSDPEISHGNDNGAYVAAWVWVDFTGTELDKEK